MNLMNEQQRELTDPVRSWTPDDFREQLRATGVPRAYIVYKDGEFHLSHPDLLRPVQSYLEQSGSFAEHEGVFIGCEEGIPALFFAFVHNTHRGLAQGGLRFWKYENLAELLLDGLRLSEGMTRKNALAGLWWGGGKGVVSLPSQYEHPSDMEEGNERREIFEAYGRFIASLGGVYYTAEDVGTKTSDMDAVFSQNRFVTCISGKLGGSGNPSVYTAAGVFRGLQAAWNFLEGTEDLAGVRVAVQGAGNVARPLIARLDDAGAEVWVSDVVAGPLEEVKRERPRVHTLLLPPEEADQIFGLDVDVIAPCARGGVINQRTIPLVKARLICGAANNILNRAEDAELLHERGICFVPDYVCNRLGIINCADEWSGYLVEDVQKEVEPVYEATSEVLNEAKARQVSPLVAANAKADLEAAELHPILGHRGRRIIEKLIQMEWHKDGGR